MTSREKFVEGTLHSARHGIQATSHVVEGVHHAVLDSLRRYNPFMGRQPHLTRGVYRAIRGATTLLGMGGARVMEWVNDLPVEGEAAPRLLKPWQLHWMSGFNAAWGDFFEEEGHAWAMPMGFARGDDPAVFSAGLPDWLPAEPSPHLVVFIHGLGMNEFAWRDKSGSSFADQLAQEFDCQPLMLRYNSGLPIHDNGELLAHRLETLVNDYPRPVQSLTLVGHSMGGLISLSAGHYGRGSEQRWTTLLRGQVCLGSPHQGANLEVAGNWFTDLLGKTPWSAPFSLVGRRRSAGIKDLRHGSLRAEDWQERDRDEVLHFHPHCVKMLPNAHYLLVASALAQVEGSKLENSVGDGLVTPDSALQPRFLEVNNTRISRQRLRGISHLALLTHPAVYQALRGWYQEQIRPS